MKQLVRKVDAELLKAGLVLRAKQGSRAAEVNGCCLWQALGLESGLVEEDDLSRGRSILRARRDLVIGRLRDKRKQDGIEILRELVALKTTLLGIHHHGVQLLPHVAGLVCENFAQVLAWDA